jgi:hypothetical protein
VTEVKYNQPQICRKGCSKNHAKDVLKLVHFTEIFIIIIASCCISSKGQQNLAPLEPFLYVAVLLLALPV